MLTDDARELPPDPRDEIAERYRIAGERARARFPNDPRAAQASFQAEVQEGATKADVQDTARFLRAKAAELIAHAERLEST